MNIKDDLVIGWGERVNIFLPERSRKLRKLKRSILPIFPYMKK